MVIGHHEKLFIMTIHHCSHKYVVYHFILFDDTADKNLPVENIFLLNPPDSHSRITQESLLATLVNPTHTENRRHIMSFSEGQLFLDLISKNDKKQRFKILH